MMSGGGELQYWVRGYLNDFNYIVSTSTYSGPSWSESFNVYEDKNAYFMEGPWGKVARPAHRNYLGHVSSTIEQANRTYTARVALKPMYDPSSARVRS